MNMLASENAKCSTPKVKLDDESALCCEGEILQQSLGSALFLDSWGLGVGAVLCVLS